MVVFIAECKAKAWLEKDKLILLEGWARDGLSDEQISHNVGIAPKTLWQWKNKYSSIGNALKKGKEVVDFEVENALLKSALEGNTTAQIFWLKNRKPKMWREKVQEADVEKVSRINIINDLPKDEENDN